ncbi:uncharacterized protein LOC120429181 [Culex pipiens pallens]|uniref:uncharacterized protein LOC120429181 n=1 Tax=Culex pipiens pallens TaxID=42434 RepID=UPI001953162E|nr:uncharacterized protein LOC120429181 [Culex pipiens pallens]XP_039450328.1 uncharacterized protein LOC120429181 [Culex pipiens pallens]
MSKEEMQRRKRVEPGSGRKECSEDEDEEGRDWGEESTREETAGRRLVRIGTIRRRNEGRNWRQRRKKEAAKKKAKRPQGPPPPDFAALLMLAEQLEPVKLKTPLGSLEKKKKEPERLMTKQEKREHEERMAYLQEKKIRDGIRNDPKLSE